MNFVWRTSRVLSELLLFFVMLAFAFSLLDLYMVASGQVEPGGPMLMHEAPTLKTLAIELTALTILGSLAFFARRSAMAKAIQS